MSLGLAVAHENTIYLAIESQGLPSGMLRSKLIHLQDQPALMLLVTGGLDHWCYVRGNYRSQTTLQEARDEVMRLLDECTEIENEACCLLCGFEDGHPICCRINKLEGEPLTTCMAPLDTVQPIGIFEHAAAAKLSAERALADGVPAEQALRNAIESRIPGNRVRGPVETHILRVA